MIEAREFMRVDVVFKRACKLAGIEPTKRQARKFLAHKGKAYPFRIAAGKDLEKGGATENGVGVQGMVQGKQEGTGKKEEEKVQKGPRI